METKTISSYMTDVAVSCITWACPIPSSLSRMSKKPLRSLTVSRSVETALSRVLKMKTSVKMCPQLPWVAQRSPQRHITTTSTITNTGMGILGAVSCPRMSMGMGILGAVSCPRMSDQGH